MTSILGGTWGRDRLNVQESLNNSPRNSYLLDIEILLDNFGSLFLIRDVRTPFSAGVLGEGVVGDGVDEAQAAKQGGHCGCDHVPQHAYGAHTTRRLKILSSWLRAQ